VWIWRRGWFWMRAQEGNCEIAFLPLLDADEVLRGTSMFLFGCFAFVFLLLGSWSLLLYIGLLLCGFSSLPRGDGFPVHLRNQDFYFVVSLSFSTLGTCPLFIN
jgi:hypothetical protein